MCRYLWPLGEDIKLDKWSIDTNLSIALLYLGCVGPGIARVGDGLSFWYFYLIIKETQIQFEFIRQGLSISASSCPIKPEEIGFSLAFAQKHGFTPEQLDYAIGEAIRVWEIGLHEDYREQSRLRDLERLRLAPIKIMQGKFSDLLRQCIDSVFEVVDIEQKFRKICLRHFNEHNVKVQQYNAFYLHDDEDSFFIFDVILWLYMHVKVATVDEFIADYKLIANESYSKEYFSLGGSLHFLSEKYLPQRIQQEKLICENGKLYFSYAYLKNLVVTLDNIEF